MPLLVHSFHFSVNRWLAEPFSDTRGNAKGRIVTVASHKLVKHPPHHPDQQGDGDDLEQGHDFLKFIVHLQPPCKALPGHSSDWERVAG